MDINRRELRRMRRKLGTRRTRREGTKTKAIRGTGGSTGQRVQKYRHFKRSRAKTRPAVFVRQFLLQAAAL